jgi:hypothetical protein
MGTFNRAILVRRVGTCGEDGVAKFRKESTDFGVVVELATLVHVDVFVGSIFGTVDSEPVAEPR